MMMFFEPKRVNRYNVYASRKHLTALIIAFLLLAIVSLCVVSASFALNVQPKLGSLIERKVQVWNSRELASPMYVDMSSDGKYVIAGDFGSVGGVCLLNESGKKLWKFDLASVLDTPWLSWVCISDDGNYVAFGGSHYVAAEYRGFVFVFDKMGQVWNKTDFAYGVDFGAISGNGERVIVSYIIPGTGWRVEAFDNAGGFQWEYDMAPYYVHSLSVSSNGDYVAVGYDGGICLLNEDALAWKDDNWPGDEFDDVRISADGKYVIAIPWYAHVVVYYNQTGKLLWNQTIDKAWGEYDLAISSDGEYAVAGGNSTIYFFDKTGLKWSYDTGVQQDINLIDISSDGYFIAASSYYGSKVFHLNKFKKLIWEMYSESINAITISGNGEYFATVSGWYGDVNCYFAKKYFDYRFVTPDVEPISNLEVKWYFANGSLYASTLTNGTGYIRFFDPHFLDYSTSAYYWQTKVGSYVLVKKTQYESNTNQVASLFDWNIYIHDAGNLPISGRVETYLWNDTLYDNRTADSLRFENMPNQTYTFKVYYQSARATWILAGQQQITLTQEEQNSTIVINVLDYHVKCVNHYNEPVPSINVSIGIDGYAEWMRALTNATGFANFQNILNDTYRVIAYYKGVVVANVTDMVTAQDQVKTVELFLIGDTQPPAIGTPSHKPQQPLLTDTVKVSVNVTDDLSGVHDVILSYRTKSLPWTNITMTYNSTSLLYQGDIPPQPAGTNVTYMITAHDNAGKQTVNDNLGSYFTYRVTQEILDYHVKCVNHYNEPVSNVNVSLYFTNGTLHKQGLTNATGFVDFLDILSDDYCLIAKYNGVVVANVTDTVATQDQTKILELFLIGDAAPPTTNDDYDDLWHTANFRINLTATDDLSGVHETYYKINDGPIQNVTAHGQPLITTEGANNKLEYWSVDNAGKEESHHILTGIKLDKTAPTGSIIINNGNAYTTSTSVTLNLTSTDTASGVYQVRYSNDGIWDTEPWETPSPTKTWILTSGDETKTVYYQIKDYAELVSETYSDTIILDTAAPLIGIPSREPAGDVQPDQPVKVSVNVTDATSHVKNVTLSYTINNGTSWTNLSMSLNSSTGLYEATIPGQPAGTWVKYKIIVYDNAENPATRDGTQPYCMYQVIPEFPPALILPLLMVLTMLAVFFTKKRAARKPET